MYSAPLPYKKGVVILKGSRAKEPRALHVFVSQTTGPNWSQITSRQNQSPETKQTDTYSCWTHCLLPCRKLTISPSLTLSESLCVLCRNHHTYFSDYYIKWLLLAKDAALYKQRLQMTNTHWQVLRWSMSYWRNHLFSHGLLIVPGLSL